MVQPAVCLCQIFFSRSGFCSFIFCLFLSWTPVKGGLHLVGSPQPIVAAPGDDVILPCRLDPEWDAVGKTVEWSRPDLRPSGPQKRVEYVFVYRFRKTDRDMMMDTYVQRTSLSQDGLRRGDVSLTIRNVSLQDQGRFRCFIPRLGMEAELQLVVDPNFVSTTTTETIPDRNIISPTPQEETRSNGRRSRMFLLFPFILFIISLSLLFIFSCNKCSKNTKFHQNLLRASASQFGCFAPEQTCVDMDQNSSQTLIVIPDQPQHHRNPGG